MATSERVPSATLRDGSDAVFDFFCEPCDSEDQHFEAVGYCEPCTAYLCTNCFRDHKRNPASRHHKILDDAHMPRTQIPNRSKDILIDPCPKHSDKLLEYICTTDDCLCCHVCLNNDHVACKRAYIPDISFGTASPSSHSYNKLAIGTEVLVDKATDAGVNIAQNEKDNDAYRSSTISDIKGNRKEMDKLLDAAEEDAIQRVNELHRENVEKINSASQSCQSVLSEAKAMAVDLGEKSNTGKNNQLFVRMKQAEHRLPAMKKDINQLKEQNISRYNYVKDKNIEDFKSTLHALFYVTLKQDGVDTKARHVADVNVKTKEDTKECLISGIAALSRDRLVVTDSHNHAVKLVDVKLNKVISRLALSSSPYDVTRIKQDQVAVAVTREGKIEIFTVTDILTKTYTMNSRRTSFSGLCYDESKFIVLDNTARAVKMVDMSGRVVGTAYPDSDRYPPFKTISYYITLNNARDVVYSTDNEADTVTCMTLRGRVIWVYKHAELKYPLGVAVCRGGDVMVCSRNTDTVHLVSRSGKFVQILLDKQRGLAPGPQAISVYEDRLWVSSAISQPEYKNFLGMFELV